MSWLTAGATRGQMNEKPMSRGAGMSFFQIMNWDEVAAQRSVGGRSSGYTSFIAEVAAAWFDDIRTDITFMLLLETSRSDVHTKLPSSVNTTQNRPACCAGRAIGYREGMNQSLSLALINSRLRRAMLLRGTFLGHSAAQAPVLVQLPNPSSSMRATILRARRARST